MIYNCATLGDSNTIELLMQKINVLPTIITMNWLVVKWKGMMLDNHIGYTQWLSIPDKNRNPMTLGFKVEHSLYPKEDTKEYSIPAYQYTNKTDGPRCQMDIPSRSGPR